MIGKEIAGRYQVKDELGSGGMGIIYSGLDQQTGQTVAIKCIKPDVIGDNPTYIQRFIQEGEVLRKLDHPNIVKMLAADEQDGQHFIVMEYVEGGSLADLLNAQGPLNVEQAVSIAIELADALTRAHHLKIIHRDLKPANVLIAEDGTPRLSDFGLARLKETTSVTDDRAIIGTLPYLSPEGFQNMRLDERTDIWAFGIVLFEMLSGIRPFRGDSIGALSYAILTMMPDPDLEVLRPDVPPALIDLIYRMLEKDPNQRIPSIRIVGADLEAILHGRSTYSPLQSRFDLPATDVFLQPKHNLPVQVTEFVGREVELGELAKLLDDPNLRLITILAPGGMGKTRLALEAGARQIGNFRDGVYFIDLGSLSDPTAIVPTIADAIGYHFLSDGREEKQQLLDFLGNKQLLLVMDNFEHLSDGSAIVTDILYASSKAQILATSRQRLSLQGETLFHLSGMDFPEWETLEDALDHAAVKLFIQGARRVRPDFEPSNEHLEDLAMICQFVGGMPLGIILSSAWLGLLSVEEVSEELKQGLDLLETDERDVPERQRSVRVVFDYSWNLMTVDEQAVFMQLSVFRGGFTRQAAQEITGATLKTLMGLVNKSLLRREADSGRYHIHELLRQYAAEKLDASSQANAVHDAHSRYYTDALHQLEKQLLGARYMEARYRIKRDIENVHAAWLWAAEHKRLDALNDLMEGLFYFHTRRWRIEEGVDLFHKAATALEMENPSGEQGMVLARLLGRQAVLSQDVPSKKLLAERSLAILENLDARPESPLALLALGVAYRLEGEYAKSVEHLRDTVMIARESHNERWLMNGLKELGRVYGDYQNQTEKAQVLLEEALHIAETNQDLASKVVILNNLGLLAFTDGNLEKAQELYEEALRIAEINRDLSFRAGILPNLAILAYRQGNPEEVGHLFEAALAITRQLNQQDETGALLNNLGWLNYGLGNYKKANEYLNECIEIDEQLEQEIPGHLLSMAHTLYAMQDYQQATRYFRKALASINESWVDECAVDAIIGIANMRVDEGQHLRAVTLFGLALPLNEDPILTQLGEAALERSKNALDNDTFQSAWEHGQSQDLQTVVAELLEEFSEEN